MKADIKHIKEDVSEIKSDNRENYAASAEALRTEEVSRKEGDRRLRQRIDEHIRLYHSGQ